MSVLNAKKERKKGSHDLIEERQQEFRKDANRKYFYSALTGVSIVVVGISYYFILVHLGEISKALSEFFTVGTSIIMGLVIAYLLNPILVFVENRIFMPIFRAAKKNPDLEYHKVARGLSILTTMILFLAALVGFFWMIIPQVYDSVISISNNMSEYYKRMQSFYDTVLTNYPQIQDVSIAIFNTSYDKLTDFLNNVLIPRMGNMAVNVSTGVMGGIKFVANFVVGMVVAVYVMAEKSVFKAQAKKITYGAFSRKNANRVLAAARYTDKVFGGFINGKIIDSIIIGVICFIAMNILGLPYPLLISVVIGITNIVPFFGPVIGAIPCAMIELMMNPLSALIFIIMILVLQQLDGNVIGPLILGDSTGLSSFWVLFAILVFGGLYGFKGMILGVPLFACIYMLAKIIIDTLLEKRNLPTETEDFKHIYEIETDTDEIITMKEHRTIEAMKKEEEGKLSFREEFLRKFKSIGKSKQEEEPANKEKDDSSKE